ncbi:hypothetical protein AVEN_243827-1 [Araneus ventricosus]|uniref:Uncharacterized protein n=1 Tax=Araneus ventricosus TaxID=182803 RepID=A0A4Y2A639_ARAVE|nr:hypothetical protein AVEN_243827-1 [Araneus ventricosus]
MLSIVSLIACRGSNAHSCSKACWSLWRVPGGTLRSAIRLPNMSHTCSMEFKVRLSSRPRHLWNGFTLQINPHKSCFMRAGVIVHKYRVGTHCSDKRLHKRCRISSRYRTAMTKPQRTRRGRFGRSLLSLPREVTSHLCSGLFQRSLAPDSVSLALVISLPFGNRSGC